MSSPSLSASRPAARRPVASEAAARSRRVVSTSRTSTSTTASMSTTGGTLPASYAKPSATSVSGLGHKPTAHTMPSKHRDPLGPLPPRPQAPSTEDALLRASKKRAEPDTFDAQGEGGVSTAAATSRPKASTLSRLDPSRQANVRTDAQANSRTNGSTATRASTLPSTSRSHAVALEGRSSSASNPNPDELTLGAASLPASRAPSTNEQLQEDIGSSHTGSNGTSSATGTLRSALKRVESSSSSDTGSDTIQAPSSTTGRISSGRPESASLTRPTLDTIPEASGARPIQESRKETRIDTGARLPSSATGTASSSSSGTSSPRTSPTRTTRFAPLPLPHNANAERHAAPAQEREREPGPHPGTHGAVRIAPSIAGMVPSSSSSDNERDANTRVRSRHAAQAQPTGRQERQEAQPTRSTASTKAPLPLTRSLASFDDLRASVALASHGLAATLAETGAHVPGSKGQHQHHHGAVVGLPLHSTPAPPRALAPSSTPSPCALCGGGQPSAPTATQTSTRGSETVTAPAATALTRAELDDALARLGDTLEARLADVQLDILRSAWRTRVALLEEVRALHDEGRGGRGGAEVGTVESLQAEVARLQRENEQLRARLGVM